MADQKSAKDLLSSLTSRKKPAPAKKDARGGRPEMELSPALDQSFRRYIGAYAVAEIVDQRLEQEKQTLDDGCFQSWTESLFKTQSRPANPQLVVEKNHGQVDMSAIFQVQERYTMNLPEVPDGKTPAEVATGLFTDLLVAAGANKADAKASAERLVSTELDFTPKTSIDFGKLVHGHYEGDGKNRTFVEATAQEQELAAKVIQLLQCRTKEDLKDVQLLSDDEQDQLIEQKTSVVVKKGFLQRVCTYAKSLEQLRAIFSVIKPVRFPSKAKFAVNDTPEDRTKRLVAEAADILGVQSLAAK